jgi:enamine deaminase RidA (YjgF/YER057c/UK114 family)
MPRAIKPAKLGAPLGLYSHGMAAPAGEIVAVAGMTGIDGDGRLAGPDVESQTRQVFANIRTVVEAAGCGMRDVVRLQTFLTGVEHIAGFMKARAELFSRHFPDGVYPTNTLVIVSALVHPELVVEVEAMAVKPARPAPPPKRPAATRQASRQARRRPRRS